MAEVLNIQERSRSFWKFFLFFLLTVAVIVAAVFFDFRMPLLENKKLTEEVKDLRVLANNQERFANKLEDVINLLDSLKKERTINPAAAASVESHFKAEMEILDKMDYGKLKAIIVDRLHKINFDNVTMENLKSDLADKDKKLIECRNSVPQNPVISQ